MKSDAESSPIYAIRRDDPELADRIVAAIVEIAREGGVEIAGVTQKNIARADRVHNDMHLVSLCTEEEFKISEDRGNLSTGCRLDRDIISQAAAAVERALAANGPRFLVLNKFGKAEEEGGGMRNAIAVALESGIPVLMSVGRLSITSLLDFAGSLVQIDEANLESATGWFLGHFPAMHLKRAEMESMVNRDELQSTVH